jgi:hypothetical protein
MSFHGNKTGSGTNDNDIVIELDDATAFDTFLLHSTAGAMDVFVTLDGTHWATAPLSIGDFGAVTSDPVVVTAPGRVYGWRGRFRKVRVMQNGGTAVQNASLTYGGM